jgi:hypothetical protein
MDAEGVGFEPTVSSDLLPKRQLHGSKTTLNYLGLHGSNMGLWLVSREIRGGGPKVSGMPPIATLTVGVHFVRPGVKTGGRPKQSRMGGNKPNVKLPLEI